MDRVVPIVLVDVHRVLGIALAGIGGVGAVLTGVALLTRRTPAQLWSVARLLVAALVVQALLGAALYAGGHRPAVGLHLLYGAAAVLAVPIALSYGRGLTPRGRLTALGAGFLAVALLGLRAAVTG